MRLTIQKHLPFSAFIASLVSKKQFGKILLPVKTIYAITPAILTAAFALLKAQRKLTLRVEYQHLVRVLAATLNECPFCLDVNLFEAKRAGTDTHKLISIRNYQNNILFSTAEKAMLAYCEQVTFTKSCTAICFAGLRQFFTEKQIVEITWLNAMENYFNMQAKAFKIPSPRLNNP